MVANYSSFYLLELTFSITAIPSTHVKVNDLPIAIVNEDSGATGENLTKQITETTSSSKLFSNEY